MGSGKGKTGEHNIMVGRVAMLLALAAAKCCGWNMEHPKNSLLEGHVLFQSFLRLKHIAVTRVTWRLGHFGADTLKPVWIYSKLVMGFRKLFLFTLKSFFYPATKSHRGTVPFKEELWSGMY